MKKLEKLKSDMKRIRVIRYSNHFIHKNTFVIRILQYLETMLFYYLRTSTQDSLFSSNKLSSVKVLSSFQRESMEYATIPDFHPQRSHRGGESNSRTF